MRWKISLFIIGITAIGVAGFFWTRPSVRPIPAQRLITQVTAQEFLEQVRAQNAPVVLVNFWASWCEPCKQEFPELLTLRKTWASKGLRVLFVSIDEPRDLATAELFLEQQHVGFETYTKGTQSLDFVTTIYPKWEGAVPTTLLFDPQLKILDAWEGDASLKEFEERVSRQLKGT